MIAAHLYAPLLEVLDALLEIEDELFDSSTVHYEVLCCLPTYYHPWSCDLLRYVKYKDETMLQRLLEEFEEKADRELILDMLAGDEDDEGGEEVPS